MYPHARGARRSAAPRGSYSHLGAAQRCEGAHPRWRRSPQRCHPRGRNSHLGASRRRSSQEDRREQRCRRHRGEQCVDAIEDATVPRAAACRCPSTPAWRFSSDSKRSPRWTTSTSARAIASHAHDGDRRTRPGKSGIARERGQQKKRVDGDRHERAINAFPRLARADRGRELAPTKRAAGEVGGGVRNPNDGHRREHEPRRACLQLHDGDPCTDQHDPADDGHAETGCGSPVVVEPRRRHEDPEQRGRAAHGEHNAIGPAIERNRTKGRRAGSHRSAARRRRTAATPACRSLPDCAHSAAAMPIAASVARPQPSGGSRKRRRRDQRNEDERGEDACGEHRGEIPGREENVLQCVRRALRRRTCSLVRPKRRSRWRYQSIAASSAAASKSGHSIGVK